jgi:hypothetical protein
MSKKKAKKQARKGAIKFALAMLKHIAEQNYEPVGESYTLAAAQIAQDAINELEKFK